MYGENLDANQTETYAHFTPISQKQLQAGHYFLVQNYQCVSVGTW